MLVFFGRGEGGRGGVWEVGGGEGGEGEEEGRQRSIMYTASAPCLCGKKAVCRVFQEIGGSFSDQMYPRSLRKVVRQLMGRNSLRPLGCGSLGSERRHDPKPCLLEVERGEHNLHVSRKAHNLLVKQREKHLSRHSVRARLALFQPGQTLPDIAWGDFNLLGPIVQSSPPFQDTLVFGPQLQLTLGLNLDLKKCPRRNF